MKKHIEFLLKDPEKISKSILEDIINDISNKDETLMYKRKDPHSDGMDEPPLSADEIDDKELAYDNYEYTKKRKLGVKVAKPIHRNGCHPDS